MLEAAPSHAILHGEDECPPVSSRARALWGGTASTWGCLTHRGQWPCGWRWGRYGEGLSVTG